MWSSSNCKTGLSSEVSINSVCGAAKAFSLSGEFCVSDILFLILLTYYLYNMLTKEQINEDFIYSDCS